MFKHWLFVQGHTSNVSGLVYKKKWVSEDYSDSWSALQMESITALSQP